MIIATLGCPFHRCRQVLMVSTVLMRFAGLRFLCVLARDVIYAVWSGHAHAGGSNASGGGGKSGTRRNPATPPGGQGDPGDGARTQSGGSRDESASRCTERAEVGIRVRASCYSTRVGRARDTHRSTQGPSGSAGDGGIAAGAGTPNRGEDERE